MPDMADRILFTVRDKRTLPAETWERFTLKAQQAGTTPARVLRDLIERYLQETPGHDTTPPQDRR